MNAGDDRTLLRDLFRRLAKIEGVEDKHLAAALGVDPAQPSRWRTRLRGDRAVRLNNATRDAIASLASPDGLQGLLGAVRQVRAVLDDLEGAAKIRSAFSGRPITASPEGVAAADAAAEEAREIGGESNDQTG